MWEGAESRRERCLINMAVLAACSMKLDDRDATLRSVLDGVRQYCARGWQHARRMPCGYVARVSRRAWTWTTGTNYYFACRLPEPTKEQTALHRVLSADTWLRSMARSVM